MPRRRHAVIITAIAVAAALAGCVPMPPASAPIAPVPPVTPTTPVTPTPTTPDAPTPSAPAPSPDAATGSWQTCNEGVMSAMTGEGEAYDGAASVMPTVAGDFDPEPICYTSVTGTNGGYVVAFFAGGASTASSLASSLTAAGWDATAFDATIFGAKGEEWSIIGASVDPAEDAALLSALGHTEVIRVILLNA